MMASSGRSWARNDEAWATTRDWSSQPFASPATEGTRAARRPARASSNSPRCPSRRARSRACTMPRIPASYECAADRPRRRRAGPAPPGGRTRPRGPTPAPGSPPERRDLASGSSCGPDPDASRVARRSRPDAPSTRARIPWSSARRLLEMRALGGLDAVLQRRQRRREVAALEQHPGQAAVHQHPELGDRGHVARRQLECLLRDQCRVQRRVQVRAEARHERLQDEASSGCRPLSAQAPAPPEGCVPCRAPRCSGRRRDR